MDSKEFDKDDHMRFTKGEKIFGILFALGIAVTTLVLWIFVIYHLLKCLNILQ
jgi:cell division protein FtsL